MSTVDQIARVMIEALLNSLWQSVLVVAVAICVLRILRNLNAATRYLILWMILLTLAFMPFLEVLLTTGKSTNPWLAINFDRETINNALHQVDSFIPDVNENDFIARLPRFNPISIPIPLKILPSLILGLWALTTVFLLSRLLKSYFYISRLKRSLLMLSSEYQQKFEEFLRSTDVRRKVVLYAPSSVKMPMAIGLFNPVILIPNGLMDELTEEQLKQVILHELAHIRRWDDWTNLLQKIIKTFFFWNPMVLYIERRLDLEREIACDDWVITLSGESKSYALCLTKLIEFSILTSSQTIATGAALHRKHIVTRIRMLLNKRRNTTPHFSRFDILMTIFIIVLSFAASIKISPFVALVGHQKDNSEPTLQTERDPVTKPVVKPAAKEPKKEPLVDLSNRRNQKANNSGLKRQAKQRSSSYYKVEEPKNAVSKNLKDSSVETLPMVTDGSSETDNLNDSVLTEALDNEYKEFSVEAFKTDKPAKDDAPALLNAINDKSGRFRVGAKDLLPDVKASSQNSIFKLTKQIDDKSEEIRHYQRNLKQKDSSFGLTLLSFRF